MNAMSRNEREHEHVPLPPGDLPVPRPGDDHHRLREEHEREREGEDEPLLAPAVQPQEPERGDPVEGDADRGEEQLPAVELLGGERAVERRKLGERDDRPGDDDGPEGDEECRRRPQHDVGLLAAELERRRGRERSREHQAERRRELEAGVRAEQNAGRRERVEPEEGRARDEGERDQQQTSVTAPPCCRRDAEAERGRDERRAEDEPEVRRVVLPVAVDRRSREQHDEEKERRGRDGDPGAGAHQRSSIHEPCLSSASR